MGKANGGRCERVYPELEVPNPVQFLDNLELLVKQSEHWKLEQNHAHFRAVVANFKGPVSAFNGKGLRIAACVDDTFVDDPAASTITFATVADQWGADNKFRIVSDLEIREAFRLFRPLVTSVCSSLSITSIILFPKPKHKYRLGDVTGRLLDGFCISANTSCMHPNDWERFFDFIHFCHAHGVRLGPGRLCHELTSRKVPEKLACKLADRYGFGRSLLKRDALGWTDESL